VGDTYEWLRYFHILLAMIAVVPAVAYPLLFSWAGGQGDGEVQKVAGFAARYDRMVFTPALILVGLMGVAIVLDRDHIEFSDSWISAAFLLWFIMNGVLHGLLIPAERKVSEGDLEAMKLVRIGGIAMIVLFLGILHLMVVKPGVDYFILNV
jgi:uncharacterized membrane protein